MGSRDIAQLLGGFRRKYWQGNFRSRIQDIDTKQAVNQNVLVGAPIDGVLKFIQEDPKVPVKIAVLIAKNGDEYVIRHMSNLPEALGGTTIKAGTVIGTMSNEGTEAVHDHMSVFTTAEIDGKVQRIAIDPYTYYKSHFNLKETDQILLAKQKGNSYNTTGEYRPSQLIDDEYRTPKSKYEGADLIPRPIGGLPALRDYLMGLEGGGDYSAVNKNGALGAFQMKPDTLTELKFLDADGKWTGKYGVWTKEDFLSNKTAQDNGFSENINAIKGQLISNGAWAHIRDTMPDGTVITEGSLIGAGWLGARNVGKYFSSEGEFNRTDANGTSVGYRLRSFSRFDPSLPEAGGTGVALDGHPTGGHLEYPPTNHNAMGDFPGAAEPVWVSDTPAPAASRPSSTITSATKPPPTIEAIPGAPADGLSFRLGNNTIIRVGNSPEDANGALVSFNKQTNTLVVDVKLGDNLYERRTYNASGQVSRQEWEYASDQIDATTGQPTQYFNGETFKIAGDTYVYATGRGLIHLGTGEIAATPSEVSSFMSQGGVTPVKSLLQIAYETVELGGQTYTVKPNGTLERQVAEHPGWVELRDSTGGGVILDRDGAVMAQLLPGDRVGMMDDGRITVNDNNGRSVNRTLDDAHEGAFYQRVSSTPVIDASEHLASNRPLAPAVSVPAATQTIANPGSSQDLLTYLDNAGAALSPAQQYALGPQLGRLGLGAVDGTTLSLHTVPGGGALLANADGEIVGEVSISPTGVLHLQANAINTDGSSSPVDLHVTGAGQVMTTGQYQEAQFNAAANDAAGTLSLVNGLANLAHFDQLTDLGKLQSLVGLYNQIDNLGSATTALTATTTDAAGNLPGNLGQWGAGLGLITALQSDNPIAQASAAGALYNTFGSASTNIPIPYLQALNLIGAIESGNTVSMLASAVAFIPGWGTAASIAISVLAPLFADKPPQPEGVTHFEWDAQGDIQIRVDFNQSHGGEMAQRTAQSVQGLLQSIVQSINDQTPDTADNVAINPYLLPRVGFSQSGGAWIEMTTPDGGSYREMIQGNNQSQGLAQRLFDILTENGGIAPAWQVQTQLGHMQQLLAQGAGQGEIAAELGAGAGGHAYHGNQAFALQGNAAETADFKTQRFGALVVHLGAGVVQSDAVQNSTQALQQLQDQQTEQRVATSDLYRDTENDGFYEKTQWVSATDAKGNLQGLLVLDYNGNGQIETRDILNLGGNAGQEGNRANDATQATNNAHLQRNNVEWLDANSDGVLDKSDPVFAAIKLWVDLNQDAQLDAGEQSDLASLHITSINFKTGEVTYADGHRDALSATTLQSDTEGVRYTQMQEADAAGNLHTINAGQMLEHEGYQGQVQVVDQGGTTRWGSVREATFEQDALTTGDWEGTAEQEQHRHGGTNVTSAPIQTIAIGAVSLGPVKRTVGHDKVLTERRLVFVPAIATLEQGRIDSPTDQMVRSAQEGALAGGMGAGLGVLAMVGLGAVQTTAFAAPDAQRAHDVALEDDGLDTRARMAAPDVPNPELSGASVARVRSAAPAYDVQGAWQEAPRHTVDAPPPPGVLADTDALQRAGLDVSAYTGLREIRATLVNGGVPSPVSGGRPGAPTDDTTHAYVTFAAAEMLLDLPKVAGEVLAGTEDTVLRIATDLLLANDSTINASAHLGSAPLHISAVGNPSHGQVSLQTSVNGAGQTVTDVVFLPDPDFYGTASFSYTVTDQYGLSGTATATVLVENVNDAPYAQGEVVSGASEDASFSINKAVLLANDGDVDDAASALSIGWVGNAVHGTVSLDANGNVVFAPGLNFNGNAEFEYMTMDAAGLLSPAVQVVMPVAAVNDAPLTVDDQFQTYVNSTMTIGFAQLLGNDSDIENDTLSLANVGNASQGVVAIVNGQVEFVPTPGFTGTASFDYLANDGNGGQTWATAFVEVKHPPNLYASVDLYGASFYGTGYNSGYRFDMADVSFAVSDDGDTAFASLALQSVSVLRIDYSSPEGYGSNITYPNYAWQSLDGVNNFAYSNTAMNLDVRRGYGFTDFQSTWQVTDNRGLANIWHLNYSMNGGASSYMEHSGYVGPVVLSLDGTAPAYISTQYSHVRYDMDMDGIADKVAWAAPGSGVLGIDLNGDHRISGADEFAFKQYVDGAQTDLQGLKAFDTNHNGLLDAGDARWSQFGVWEDKNADGQTQNGEYLSLDALGIATINLQSNAQTHSGLAVGGGASTDVTVMGDTTFTRADGSSGVAADAMFAYQSGVHAQAAEADLARMALLFNQIANTALIQDAEPLGFVPVQPVDATLTHEDFLALQAA